MIPHRFAFKAFLPLVVTLPMVGHSHPVSFSAEQKQQEAKTRIQTFASQLKSELSQAISQGGLANGVAVCHQRAPQIAATLSAEGWSVSRTSLKTRNKDNRPDAWERDMLVDFESRLLEQGNPQSLVAVKTSESEYRFMKAIPVAEICLACHGQNIDHTAREALK